jgi:hypothetical protein
LENISSEPERQLKAVMADGDFNEYFR